MNIQNILPAQISKKTIPTLYTWIAPTHDWLAVLVESKARQRGLEWASVQDGEQVLEVAVGTGLSFQHIVTKNITGYNVGIDITPAMLKKARSRTRRVCKRASISNINYTLSLGDAYGLSYPDDCFDLVLNSYMFDLLPVDDFVPVLSEFNRVLKPGGRLVMLNMTHGEAWYNHLWSGIYKLHPALLGGCRNIVAAPFLKKAGFVQVEREYISQWTFPSEIIRGVSTIHT